MNLTKSQLDSAKTVACEKCSCEIMKQAVVIKQISALVSPDGRETFIPVPVFICNSCNHLNEIFAKELGLAKSPLIAD